MCPSWLTVDKFDVGFRIPKKPHKHESQTMDNEMEVEGAEGSQAKREDATEASTRVPFSTSNKRSSPYDQSTVHQMEEMKKQDEGDDGAAADLESGVRVTFSFPLDDSDKAGEYDIKEPLRLVLSPTMLDGRDYVRWSARCDNLTRMSTGSRSGRRRHSRGVMDGFGSPDTYRPGDDDDEQDEYSDYDMQLFFNDRDVRAAKDNAPVRDAEKTVPPLDRWDSEDEPYYEEEEGGGEKEGELNRRDSLG
jgi:hypothetical protein